ncbi:transposase [Catenulispora acidiphila]|uniref:transposase n=1 Tax=Catenulispora acidiphila TaxID=304895 RepID=UPI00019E3354|nr:transposase [Catenulispora acidiphila]
MLPDLNIPTLTALLTAFRPCFTAPGYRTFTALVIGLIGQTRRHTVCGMLLGANLAGVWHHSRGHRFFAAARWCVDEVALALADTIIALLLDQDAGLVLAVDDTLFRRSGRNVFGTAWHHDGAAKGPKPIGFGNCWVIAGLVVTLPFLARPGLPADPVPTVAPPARPGRSHSPGSWLNCWLPGIPPASSTSSVTPPMSVSTCAA